MEMHRYKQLRFESALTKTMPGNFRCILTFI